MLPDSEALRIVSTGELYVPPLEILEVTEQPFIPAGYRADFLLRLAWRDWTRTFLVEYKGTSTPKAVQAAMEQVRRMPESSDSLPMVLTPYLARENLDRLLQAGVSGLDLSGNAVIVDPGRLFVYRTGADNRYPERRAIQAVYAGKSSLVPRVLMVKPRFEFVKDVRSEIQRRGVEISLATVSKVLQVLEDELLISKRPMIELRRPETLLERLADGYSDDPVTVERRLSGKVDLPAFDFQDLSSALRTSGIRAVGATCGPDDPAPESDVLALYVDSVERFLRAVPVNETSRFPNIELRQTQDPRAYFDSRASLGFQWLSPMQRYLELATGGKREKDVASVLRERILETVSQAS